MDTFDTVEFIKDTTGRTPAPFQEVPVARGTIGRILIKGPGDRFKVGVFVSEGDVPKCFVEANASMIRRIK